MGADMRVTVGGLHGKMQLTGRGHSSHEVKIDYTPPLGEDDGLTSLELLMISLASCSSHTVLTILRKMGKTVEDVTVNAVGERRMDAHPTMITAIELQFSLKGTGLDAPSVERSFKLAEEMYCPVWAMLKGNVAVSWNYSINAG